MTPLARCRRLAARCSARLPAKKRRHTSAERDAAARAISHGSDPVVIADMCGVTPATVRRWYRAMEAERRRLEQRNACRAPRCTALPAALLLDWGRVCATHRTDTRWREQRT